MIYRKGEMAPSRFLMYNMIPSIAMIGAIPTQLDSLSLSIESLIFQLGDETLMKLTTMITYKLVSCRTTTKIFNK